MKKFKNLEKIIFIAMFILTVSITGTIYAKENFEFKINNIEDTTPEYQKWDSLPEGEKENYIQPLPFSTQLEENSQNSNNYNINLKSSLPAKYFLKDDINLTVRDQKQTPACWTFATTNIIATNMEKIGITNNFTLFSTRHMDYTTSQSFLDGANPKGFNRQTTGGGNSYLGLAYCVAGYGPILESNMPFENNQNKINLSEIENKTTAAKVEEYNVLPSITKKYDSDGTVYYNGYSENSSEYVTKIEPIRNQIKEYI